MMLYCSTIEFKQKRNTYKQQSQLSSMRNYDVVRFCFNSEIRKTVSATYKITKKFIIQHVSLHEIDIHSL